MQLFIFHVMCWSTIGVEASFSGIKIILYVSTMFSFLCVSYLDTEMDKNMPLYLSYAMGMSK